MDLGKVIIVMVILIYLEKDKVCKKRIYYFVNYLIKNGLDGLVIVGIIGEFLILFYDEKIKLFC